jgi:hypothetical protein
MGLVGHWLKTVEPREDKMMVDGLVVPLIAFGALAAMWAVVLFISGFFGPR